MLRFLETSVEKQRGKEEEGEQTSALAVTSKAPGGSPS